MLILGIETSCDETAAAVVADGRRILSSVVASQVELHARFGGVVPEIASRQHLLAFLPTVRRALAEAAVHGRDLQAVAVTTGPGLPGSLLAGVNGAKALALGWGLPVVGVNHLEGHLYAHWLEGEPPDFPVVVLIVSGGHTELVLVRGHGQYVLLGRTRDDAAGEAFDKVARLLRLGYPGGPAIERAARGAAPVPSLPRAWLRGTGDFSFSGLKTAVLRYTQVPNSDFESRNSKRGLAASFQEAVVDVLVTKTVAAALAHRARAILVAGGVAANARLREAFQERSPLPVRFPSLALCGDNGAMAAALGYYRLQAGGPDGWDLDIRPGWRIESWG